MLFSPFRAERVKYTPNFCLFGINFDEMVYNERTRLGAFVLILWIATARKPCLRHIYSLLDLSGGSHAEWKSLLCSVTCQKRLDIPMTPLMCSTSLVTSTHNNSLQLVSIASTNPKHRALTYEEAVAKGTKLLQRINEPPSSTSVDRWKFSDLRANGWKQPRETRYGISSSGVAPLMKDRGIDAAPDKNLNIMWEYYPPDSSPASGTAKYVQTYNAECHTIFATSLTSPAATRLQDPEFPVPALGRWSDVTYLQWAAVNKDRPQGLSLIVQGPITNKQTQRIIDRVLRGENGNGKTKLGYRDRRIFREGDGDAFRALLGSPNGVGTGWLLADRKGPHQLGWKRVESIALYCADPTAPRRTDHMVIEIGKHPDAKDA